MRIDPLVDCVFKAVFGHPDHTHLLVSLLESVLRPERPLRGVTVLNPFSERDFWSDKLVVLDVKAEDDQGRVYQVEVQVARHAALAHRMLYTWTRDYRDQLGEGERWARLAKATSVWILGESILPGPRHHHRFLAWDPVAGIALSDHLEIHTVELPKWHPEGLAPEDRWLYFFKESVCWDAVPAALWSRDLEEAMSLVRRFGEDSRARELYERRMDYLRTEATWQAELAEAAAALGEAVAEKDRAVADKDRAVADKDRAVADKDRALARLEAAHAEKEREKAEKERVLARLAELERLLRDPAD